MTTFDKGVVCQMSPRHICFTSNSRLTPDAPSEAASPCAYCRLARWFFTPPAACQAPPEIMMMLPAFVIRHSSVATRQRAVASVQCPYGYPSRLSCSCSTGRHKRFAGALYAFYDGAPAAPLVAAATVFFFFFQPASMFRPPWCSGRARGLRVCHYRQQRVPANHKSLPPVMPAFTVYASHLCLCGDEYMVSAA